MQMHEYQIGVDWGDYFREDYGSEREFNYNLEKVATS